MRNSRVYIADMVVITSFKVMGRNVFVWIAFVSEVTSQGLQNQKPFKGTLLSLTSQVPVGLDVYSLWPSDVTWRQESWSTLAQVMGCCLTAPSRYLNQCWLMISEVMWHSPDSNFTENTSRYFPLKWVWNLLIWDWNPPGANELISSEMFSLVRCHKS